MKKFFLMAAVIIMGAVNVNAQYKPEKMSVATEINYSGSNVSLPEFGARARLFLNENMVVRLGLGFSTTSDKNTVFKRNIKDEEYEEITTNSSTSFSLLPGFEYHFSKFERVSPYVGAELGFVVGSDNTKYENADDKTQNTDTKQPTFGFKIGAVTGVDVHIYKGFYLGAELGLGYQLSTKGRGETETNSGTFDGQKSSSDNQFSLYATPALRIGWFF